MTVEDEQRMLLKAVTDHPDDDAPRLAYADWCDRRGDPRGRFIRVQIELAKIGEHRDDPNRLPLQWESTELLSLYEHEWMPQGHPYILRSKFHRGFIASIELTADDFLEHASDLYAQFPIQLIEIEKMSGRAREVLTSPHLEQICAASFSRSKLTDDDIRAFAQSPFIRNIWWLDLTFNKIGMPGVEALVTSTFLTKLGYVALDENPCNPIESAGDDQGTVTEVWLPADGKLLEQRFGHIKWLHRRSADPLLTPEQR